MADLHHFQAEVCITASGALVHQGKLLLIKHKKLGMWLTPGGHVDPGEAPHQAAEREVWEETGIKVRALPFGYFPDHDHPGVQYVPLPVQANLHWISQDNYQQRLKAEEMQDADQATTDDLEHQAYDEAYDPSRSCEQHANYMFLVEATDGIEFKENTEEVDGIAWYTAEEIEAASDILPVHKQEFTSVLETHDQFTS